MVGVVRSRSNALTAAACGVVVVSGLVFAPPEPLKLAAARVELAAVQLQSAVATELSAAVNTETVVTAAGAVLVSSSSEIVQVPPANATDDLITKLLSAAVAIALAPLWYVAFPVTLPISLALGAFGSGLAGWWGSEGAALLSSVLFGLTIFTTFPFFAITSGLPLSLIGVTPSPSAASGSGAMSEPAIPRSGGGEVTEPAGLVPEDGGTAIVTSAAAEPAASANPVDAVLSGILDVADTVLAVVLAPVLIPAVVVAFWY